MTYAFSFDASACSGCKTCQEACKDKNGLPVGVLWRRVIEVSGGEWQLSGNSWENSVFAYNLTLACNHCVHPKCAGVCPTDAYIVRPDGIVLIDASKCMGCGYCAWACPYAAPQYDREQGIMTKCDFCRDNIDAGLPPACVAACPLRVLDYGRLEELNTSGDRQPLWQLPGTEHPFPLPNYSRTEPHLVIKPHAGMKNSLDKTVANLEELQPRQPAEKTYGITAARELPLVAFTLLIQMAAGMGIWGLGVDSLPITVLLIIDILLGFGGAISFLHLGRKRNAWQAVKHLQKSWLSWEILMSVFFGAAGIVTLGMGWLTKASPGPWLMAALGIGLIYSMGQVYLLRAVPAWNSWRTPAAFYLSALVLGGLGLNLITPFPWLVLFVGMALAVELGMALTVEAPMYPNSNRLRVPLLGLGGLGTVAAVIFPQSAGRWLAIPIFIIVLAGEIIGRWQFYASRENMDEGSI